MLHLDHGGIFDYGLNRRAVHTLVARESHFDEAGGAVTAIVVIMGLYVLLGIILAILSVIVLVRRPGNRGPYVWLLLAACTFALSNLLDIPRWVMWYDDDMNYEIYTNIGTAASIFYWWNITFLFAAALFVLRNRRNAAMAANGIQPGALEILKLVLDIILLVTFGVLALARSAYLATVNNGEFNGREDYEYKLKTYLGMGYGLVVIMLLLVLDLGISAVNVRSRVSGPDLPSKVVLAAVVPMFIFHWIWQTGMIIYGAIIWHRRLVVSKRTDDAVNMTSTLEYGLIIGGIMLALLIVGLKSAAWGQPIGRQTVYSGQPGIQSAYAQQPQYFQQQIYQPQQVVQYPQQYYPQPGVVYAQPPMQPQQQVVPNLPQV